MNTRRHMSSQKVSNEYKSSNSTSSQGTPITQDQVRVSTKSRRGPENKKMYQMHRIGDPVQLQLCGQKERTTVSCRCRCRGSKLKRCIPGFSKGSVRKYVSGYPRHHKPLTVLLELPIESRNKEEMSRSKHYLFDTSLRHPEQRSKSPIWQPPPRWVLLRPSADSTGPRRVALPI